MLGSYLRFDALNLFGILVFGIYLGFAQLTTGLMKKGTG
jgi:hypothetical protein